MEELLNILEELKPDVDFKSEQGLIDNAILDSFDIVQLVGKQRKCKFLFLGNVEND